jgi:AraC-like DNA-binding protein
VALVGEDTGTMTLARYEGDGWRLFTRRPEPALRGHVVELEGFEERAAAPLRRRHLPATFVPLILNFGAPWRLFDPADERRVVQQSSFVSGLGEAGGMTEAAGEALCVQVNLTPLGARRVLGVPMHELENREVSLDDMLGREAERLEERLFEASDWASRLDLVEGFLAARLDGAPPVRPDVVRAWGRLEETGGRLRVEALASELRCSRKHLATQFRDYVGPSPKTAARILRFNRLLRLIAREPRPGWAELAASCGYADQAHLSREVRRLAGCTPRQLAGETAVTFVQDALAAAS